MIAMTNYEDKKCEPPCCTTIQTMSMAYVQHLFPTIWPGWPNITSYMYRDDKKITRMISGLPTNYKDNGCILSVCHLKK